MNRKKDTMSLDAGGKKVFGLLNSGERRGKKGFPWDDVSSFFSHVFEKERKKESYFTAAVREEGTTGIHALRRVKHLRKKEEGKGSLSFIRSSSPRDIVREKKKKGKEKGTVTFIVTTFSAIRLAA